MGEPEFRRIFRRAALATLMAFAGASGLRVATAQGAPDPGVKQPVTDDDDDADWGWIGLLGLAGLLGPRRRDTDRHLDPTRRP
jgi:MYXO-CTERM domain-containing protein